MCCYWFALQNLSANVWEQNENFKLDCLDINATSTKRIHVYCFGSNESIDFLQALSGHTSIDLVQMKALASYHPTRLLNLSLSISAA